MTKTLSTPTTLRLLAVAASAVLLAALAAQPAVARDRTVTVTGANGQTAERQVSREKGQVSSSTTGPKGQSVSREVARGGGQLESTVTGSNGRQWQRVVDRDATGREATRTAPNGRTVVRNRVRGER
jgi:predicted porin